MPSLLLLLASGPAHAVVGGEAAPEADYAVALGVLDGEALEVVCSGSRVQAGWVLTAAHCVDAVEGLGGEAVVASGPSGEEARVGWARALVHPDWDGTGPGDLALIELVETLPGEAWVALQVEALDPSWAGTSLLHVGYGDTADLAGDRGERRAVALPILDVLEGSVLAYGAGNVCDGDSGGPAVLETADGPVQLAVHQLADPACVGGTAVSTRVDVALDWVLEHVPDAYLDPADLPEAPGTGEPPAPGPGEPVDGEAQADEKGCATVGSGGAWGALAGLLLAGRRRER